MELSENQTHPTAGENRWTLEKVWQHASHSSASLTYGSQQIQTCIAILSSRTEPIQKTNPSHGNLFIYINYCSISRCVNCLMNKQTVFSCIGLLFKRILSVMEYVIASTTSQISMTNYLHSTLGHLIYLEKQRGQISNRNKLKEKDHVQIRRKSKKAALDKMFPLSELNGIVDMFTQKCQSFLQLILKKTTHEIALSTGTYKPNGMFVSPTY